MLFVFLKIQSPISSLEDSTPILFECSHWILLKDMASKKCSWVHYKGGKTLALCGFTKIQRPISLTVSSIPILFECPQSTFICGSECMGSFFSELQFSSQEFAPKSVHTEFAVCHAFDREAAF